MDFKTAFKNFSEKRNAEATLEEFSYGMANFTKSIELFHGEIGGGTWLWMFMFEGIIYARKTEYSPIPVEIDLGIGQSDTFYIFDIQ